MKSWTSSKTLSATPVLNVLEQELLLYQQAHRWKRFGATPVVVPKLNVAHVATQ